MKHILLQFNNRGEVFFMTHKDFINNLATITKVNQDNTIDCKDTCQILHKNVKKIN